MTKELIDALHEQGWHLVTRSEWYEMQLQLSAPQTEECADYQAALEEIWRETDDGHIWGIAGDALDKHAKRQTVG